MAPDFGVIKFLLLLALVERALLAPSPPAASPRAEHQDRDLTNKQLVELKLPVKITSMHDLVAWARNAMRSMASRIDITLESVGDEVEEQHAETSPTKAPAGREDSRSPSSAAQEFRLKPRKPKEQQQQQQQRERPAHARQGESRRPVTPSALVSTYASLLEPSGALDSLLGGHQNDAISGGNPYGNLNAYLPLFLDDAEIARYREEALRKYYLEGEQAKRHQLSKKRAETSSREKNSAGYAQAQRTSQVRVGDDDDNNDDNDDSNEDDNNNNNNKGNAAKKGMKNKESEKLKPVISVPFEAIVTITRENVAEPQRAANPPEMREPPDEFPPYFERDERRRDTPPEKPEASAGAKTKRPKEQKRQIATLGDLLRMLGFTKKVVGGEKGGKGFEGTKTRSSRTRPKKPSDKFTPPPIFQFEDEQQQQQQPQRQRRNETSQRQEFDDEEDDEEPTGSLGSITDLLPLVIPILEDISDPNTETDLGEVLEAAIPLVQGLSEPNEDDPDAPDILAMIGPILTKIIGGKDGQGSDVAAILGPAIGLVAPLIGPILGPLVGPLLSASSNPPQGEGSSLATLISAVLGPLTQPTEHSGMSPLSVLTAGVIAALSKELRPGLPGGLDVGAVVASVLNGVIAGTSAGLSGTLSADNKNTYQPYGPAYGAGPVQAGSTNTGTNAGFVFPGPQANSPQQLNPQQPVPAHLADHHRIVHRTTRRPYSTLPQRIPPGPSPPRPPLPPPPPPPSYVQPQITGPLQAGTTNNGAGDSSYLPYGTNNAVPANSVNPIGLISNLIKDILGAGIQVGSSVINAVFGIIGSSSSDEPKPVYGPPAPAPYGQHPR